MNCYYIWLLGISGKVVGWVGRYRMILLGEDYKLRRKLFRTLDDEFVINMIYLIVYSSFFFFYWWNYYKGFVLIGVSKTLLKGLIYLTG